MMIRNKVLISMRPAVDSRIRLMSSDLLDKFLPERLADFPARHIGPRKNEAKLMLEMIGYKVWNMQCNAPFITNILIKR